MGLLRGHKKILKFTEVFLITFVWMVILITPILFRENNNNSIFRSVAKQLETLIPITLLFLINRFVLVPYLLFKGKQIKFIMSVASIIAILMLSIYIYHKSTLDNDPWARDSRKDRLDEQNSPFPRPDKFVDPRPPQQQVPRPIPPYANFLILSFLIVGFDTGLRATLRWTEVEQEKIRLEKDNVASQLVLLRNQVSPHFFMNTLNNIHSLVDINSEEAKAAIIKLSKMMRYLLYETETEKTTLKKEVEFIESYVNLMRLRFSEKVEINLNLPTIIPDKSIPPFLFLSLIENAFKHGVSYRDESFINIDLTIGSDKLLLVIRNSKVEKNSGDGFSGIGIENTRKRLALLYGKNYNFDIFDSPDIFTVSLSIPI